MYTYRLIIKTLFMLALFIGGTAQAALTDSLQGLTAQGSTLEANLSAFSFETGGDCSQLGTLNTSIEDYIDSIEAVTAQITSPLSLTQTDLTSLDELSAAARTMAVESSRIAVEIRSIDDLADLAEYRSGLSAMLRLSQDIGTMANRILEMADRILQMADNIGTMADKIVYTMNLQSANLAFIQSAIVTTMENMAQLNASLSTIAYNLTLGQLVSDGNGLAAELNATQLSETNMADEVSRMETKVAAMQSAALALAVLVNTNSAVASHYVDGDTLTYVTDLSEINRALATGIELYASEINRLAPLTQTPVLSDATAAMLQLAYDVKVMGDRIMEMNAKIITMADNVGIMAGRIVEVQGILNTDMQVTAASLSASQRIMVGVIGAYGL